MITVMDIFRAVDEESMYYNSTNWVKCEKWPNGVTVAKLHSLGWRYAGDNLWRNYGS